MARVEVTIGDKTEMRTIDHVDRETGLIHPVVADHELVAHTVDGKILVIPNVRPFAAKFEDEYRGDFDCDGPWPVCDK